jgi:hypothetical protein
MGTFNHALSLLSIIRSFIHSFIHSFIPYLPLLRNIHFLRNFMFFCNFYSYGNSRVVILDGATLQFVAEFGSDRAGSRRGEFRIPHSLTIDHKGFVYVADRENARVQVFTADGDLSAVWPCVGTDARK